MIWIHCIGRLYYSVKKFITEANRYGVTRRIAPQILMRMSLNDEVFLSISEGKGQLVFGKFVVNGVSGLTPEAVNYLREKGAIGEQLYEGGRVINRGCGSYVEGPTYKLETSISEVGKLIKGSKIKTPLMVMGSFEQVQNFILEDVPFRPGFRPFDYESFQGAKPIKFKKGLPVYSGQFYAESAVTNLHGGKANSAIANSVINYTRKEGS